MGMMTSWQGGRRGRNYPRIAPLLLGLTAVATGLIYPVAAQAQIAQTKHNLGTSQTLNGTGNNYFTGTAEICVFCHTPHGADSSAAVPLWNRSFTTATTYTTYDSLGTSSLDGRVAPVGSVSIACLSCHDGLQSMSSVINQPGSGLSNATFSAGTWVGTRQAAGRLNTQPTLLGTNLQNDHPIGIQYAGGGYTTSATAGPGTDPDFKAARNAVVGSTRVWWVDTEATPNSQRNKTDMLLYTRASGSGYTGQTLPEPFVECASCHDPHTSNVTFLRIPNAGSAVCLACHTK